jgi:hypothetical protein
MDIEGLQQAIANDDCKPHLPEPEIDQILQQAGIDGIPSATARSTVLAAMQKAAGSRLAGVTEQKRRSHYDHAAQLVAICVGCDRSPKTAHWVASIEVEYKRFRALRDELNRALKRHHLR